MRCSTYRLVLAGLMVTTGTLNTLVSKWMTTESAINSIGIKDNFRHPFLQAAGQFAGEFACLLIYFAFRLTLKLFSNLKRSEEKVRVIERRQIVKEIIIFDNEIDKGIQIENEDKISVSIKFDSDSSDNESVHNDSGVGNSSDSESAVIDPVPLEPEKPQEFTWTKCWLFIFPAICDATATSSMYVGLSLTTASSYQMLRGSVIIFTGLASRFLLRKKLTWYKWVGMFIILAGLFIVGSADVLSNKCKGTVLNKVVHGEFCDEKAERMHNLIGDMILIAAQIIVAIQNTYEERVLKKYDIHPMQAVGWEGFFGFSFISASLVALAHIGTNSKDWGHSPQLPYYVEDPIDGLIQLKNNPSLMAAFIGIVVSICIFLIVGMSVTQEMSATTKNVLDTVRTIFIWAISLGLQWQTFHFLQPLGFLCIILGMCFYYNLLVVPLIRKVWKKITENVDTKTAASGHVHQ